MLRVALLQVLLFSCWQSSHARGIYQLVPVEQPHQGINLLIPDGSPQSAPSPYSFAYTAEGAEGSSSHQQTSSASGAVSGSYSLKIKDGRSRQVAYTADAGGFKAKVDTNEPGTKSDNPAEVSFHSSAPQVQHIGIAAIPAGGPAIVYQGGIGAVDGAPSPYSFGYTAEGADGSSSHQESGDGSGNVKGRYSLKVKDGRSRQVDYTADAGGFKAKIDTNELGTKTGSSADAHFYSSAPQELGTIPEPYAGAPTQFGGIGSVQVSQSFGAGGEGAPSPYSFSYNAEGLDGGSARQETSDGAGNVRGSYSLNVKDGRNRKVDYTADAAGFKASVNTNEPGTKSDSPADAAFYSSAPQLAPAALGAPAAVGIPVAIGIPALGTHGSSVVTYQGSIGGEGAPSPYSFGYTAQGIDGSSAHQESSDGAGNVKGSYSLKIKDGRSRQVGYTADATGFKANVNTNEPGTKSESPAQSSFHSSAPQIPAAHIPVFPQAGPYAAVPSGGAATVSFQSGVPGGEGAPIPYSFGYTAQGADGGSSHQESSDGSGKVSGSYSLNVKDGRRRKVDYTADAGGFKANVDTNEPGTKSDSPAQVSFHSSSPHLTQTPDASAPFVPTWNAGASAVSYQGGLGGAEGAPSPYSFGYTAAGPDGSSSHQESSDGSGNVKGSYSLKIKDGRSRQVDYMAGAAGFTANVNTNEPGTKSDATAGATFHSSAPQIAPVAAPFHSSAVQIAPVAALYPSLSAAGVPPAISFQLTPGGPEGAPSPYSFGYTAEGIDGGSSHQETGDGSGGVRGSYSLQIKDGRKRRVDYTADGAGFKARVDTNEPGTKSDSPAEVSFHSSAPQLLPAEIGAPLGHISSAGGAIISYQGGIAGAEGGPIPYSFGYTAGGAEGSASHQESGDASGRVSGSYSLSVNDGRKRKVDYTADAGGFKASVDTNEPGTKSHSPAEVSFHSSAALTAADLHISPPSLQSIIHSPRPLTDAEKRWVKSL